MDSKDDSIEIHYDKRRGSVALLCGPAAFGRILGFVRDEASFDTVVGEAPDGVSEISIVSSSRYRKSSPSWLRDRVALVGCGVVGIIVAGIFTAGILALAGYLHPPR